MDREGSGPLIGYLSRGAQHLVGEKNLYRHAGGGKGGDLLWEGVGDT